MKLAILLASAVSLAAQTADEIMARVAENQARAEDARKAFVYHQNLLVRLKRANGKLAREEVRDYTVTPAASGVEREMVKFAGKYGDHGKEFAFSEPGQEHKSMDIDAGLVKSIANHFGGDHESKDGINHELFPLSARHQKVHRFHMEGREQYKGREVFRVTFEPVRAAFDDENGGDLWAGEALIDAEEYQPVLVTTHMAKGIPLAVKMLLGTNVTQMGFKVTYQKCDEGLWFPVTFGGELKVRAVFLYARTISIGLINSDFRHAEVDSKIAFEKGQ